MTAFWQRAVRSVAALLVFWAVAEPASAGVTPKDESIKLRAHLIWGTNDGKSPDPNHKELEGSLRKKLSGVFQWKHYFEVKKTEETLEPKAVKRVKLSSKCEVELKNLGHGMVNAKLFGEGKALVERKLNLGTKEPVVLGGHDKDNTAWFVVLSPL